MEDISTGASLSDALFYFVPAFLVLLGMFMLVRRFTDAQLSMIRKLVERDMQERVMTDRAHRRSASLPLKLQAYERLILFLERISPNSLLVRVQQGSVSAQMLHLELLVTIRSEFEHNLSQQLYVSDDAWSSVCTAKDEVLEIVNEAFRIVGPSASGVQLSTKIFELVMGMELLPTYRSIAQLKKEAVSQFI